jgi:hypothetical protein
MGTLSVINTSVFHPLPALKFDWAGEVFMPNFPNLGCVGTDSVGKFVLGSGCTTTPGGSTGAIQYNNGSGLGGAVITGFVYGNGSGAPTAGTLAQLIAAYWSDSSCTSNPILQKDGTCTTAGTGGGGTVTDSAGTTTPSQLAVSTTTLHQVAYTTAIPNGTTATTQSPGDNTTKVATDAFVLANSGSGTVNDSAGTSTPNQLALSTSTTHHIQYSTAVPNGTTGTTQAPGDNTTKLATDAFVLANVTASSTSYVQRNGTLFPSQAATEFTDAESSAIYEATPHLLSGSYTKVFKLWFSRGWTTPTTSLYYAESADGMPGTWTIRPTAVISGFAHGWVFKVGSTYHAYGATSSGGTSISHWTSTDGLTWTLSASNVFTATQGMAGLARWRHCCGCERDDMVCAC